MTKRRLNLLNSKYKLFLPEEQNELRTEIHCNKILLMSADDLDRLLCSLKGKRQWLCNVCVKDLYRPNVVQL